MIQQPSPPPRSGVAAPVIDAGARALAATDRLIDRHDTVRAVADFDVRALVAGRYGGRWRLVVFACLVVIASVVVILVGTHQIGDVYLWIRQHDPFPGDRYYTEVMRDHPWVYLIGGAIVNGILLLVLPRRLWLNEVMVIMGSGTVGFVGGHVFW